MVIDFVMVTAPKPPGSMQLISPFTAVFEIAPAKVLHGAVRLHGLASSPTPDVQVRVACANPGVAQTTNNHPNVHTHVINRIALRIVPSSCMISVGTSVAGSGV